MICQDTCRAVRVLLLVSLAALAAPLGGHAQESTPIVHDESDDGLGLNAELQAELAAIEADSMVADDRHPIDIYGFADFTFSRLFAPRDTVLAQAYGAHSNFAIGNFNLYIASDLGASWRSMAEIRFTYLPNGHHDFMSGAPRVSTQVSDYPDLSRQLLLGGIVIERVYVEYTAHSLLTLRAGQWLTPYGIWNVDHGSPTIITTRRPYVVGEELFPERQMGVQAYGSLPIGEFTLAYNLTISNGRGPIQYRDLDSQKALGGRLELTTHSWGRLNVGVSSYYGRATDSHAQIGLQPDGRLIANETVASQFDELSYAIDAQWDYQGLRLQGEFIVNERAYTEQGRPPASPLAGEGPSALADLRRYGAYALVGYRMPWLGIMPYMMGEFYRLGPYAMGRWDGHVLTAGLNIRPAARVVFKLQALQAHLASERVADALGVSVIRALESQVAWAF